MDSRNTENTGFQHDKKDGYKQSDLVRALEEAEDHLLLTDNEFSKTKAHALLKRLFDRVTSQETRLAIEEMLSTKNALRLKAEEEKNLAAEKAAREIAAAKVMSSMDGAKDMLMAEFKDSVREEYPKYFSLPSKSVLFFATRHFPDLVEDEAVNFTNLKDVDFEQIMDDTSFTDETTAKLEFAGAFVKWVDESNVFCRQLLPKYEASALFMTKMMGFVAMHHPEMLYKKAAMNDFLHDMSLAKKDAQAAAQVTEHGGELAAKDTETAALLATKDTETAALLAAKDTDTAALLTSKDVLIDEKNAESAAARAEAAGLRDSLLASLEASKSEAERQIAALHARAAAEAEVTA